MPARSESSPNSSLYDNCLCAESSKGDGGGGAVGAGRAEPASSTPLSLCGPPGLYRQPTGAGGGRDGDAGARTRACGVSPPLFALSCDRLGPHDTLASLFPLCSPTSASLAGCTQDSAPAPCLQARGYVSETGGFGHGQVPDLGSKSWLGG